MTTQVTGTGIVLPDGSVLTTAATATVLGNGQIYSIVAHVSGTRYTNTTTKPWWIIVSGRSDNGSTISGFCQLSTSTSDQCVYNVNGAAYGGIHVGCFLVPPGYNYYISGSWTQVARLSS